MTEGFKNKKRTPSINRGFLKMKIALAQIDVVSNKPGKNVETMLRMIEKAKKKGVDLIAFPEMCVGGYIVGDKWLEDSYCSNMMKFNEKIIKASDGIAIVYGNVYLDKDINERVNDATPHLNKDGRTRKYNAIYAVQNKKFVQRAKETKILPAGVQPKTLLPNYRFFDEERYFFSLQDIAKDFNVTLEELVQPFVFNIKGRKVKIGLELCEDLWCEDYRKNGKSLNPTKTLTDNGAERVINLSASPWTYGKNDARDRRVKCIKKDVGEKFIPFLYVNVVGAQNNGKNIITFDGGSTIYNSEGLPVLHSKTPYEEELLIVDESVFSKEPVERIEKPKIAQKYEAVIRGIKHVKDMNGFSQDPKYVIGLSGGVDSGVVASLLVKAVGKENVLAINMPTKYNSKKTKNAAKHIAQKLGIQYVEAPIEDIVKMNETLLERSIKSKLTLLQRENIQAKLRGTALLSNIAPMINGLFTNNGNKLEIALGYATLYGDVGGAFSPLGDLSKAEVFDMARYINTEIFNEEIIPEILIPDELFRFRKDQIQPSAELKKKQVDPMKFGYHCALLEAMTDYKKKTAEDVMKWYIKGTLEKNLDISHELVKRWNIDNPEEFIKDLEWFDGLVHKNVFKRVQSPPIIITSKSAYGYDIRESILPYEPTLEHQKLKKQILKMKSYKPEVKK